MIETNQDIVPGSDIGEKIEHYNENDLFLLRQLEPLSQMRR